MNKTKNGRWNRYTVVDGEQLKRCTGPLHDDEGEYLPMQRFFILKNGKRAGKPMSRCKDCLRYDKFGDTSRGLIEVSRVWWIFLELQNRLGKTETCRRIGVSGNLWFRIERGMIVRIYRRTAIKAIYALREARQNNEVRHRDSIKHGAKQRGRKEKIPTQRTHFYRYHGDADRELKRKSRERLG